MAKGGRFPVVGRRFPDGRTSPGVVPGQGSGRYGVPVFGLYPAGEGPENGVSVGQGKKPGVFGGDGLETVTALPSGTGGQRPVSGSGRSGRHAAVSGLFPVIRGRQTGFFPEALAEVAGLSESGFL